MEKLKAYLSLLFLLHTFPLLADTIYLRDGKTIENITVSQENTDFVKYQGGAVEAERVVFVYYSRTSKAFEEAQKNFRSQKFSEAIPWLQKVLKSHRSKDKKFHIHAYLYLAECYQQLGDFNNAVSAYKKATKSSKLPSALATLYLALYYRDQNKKSDATKTFEKLKRYSSSRTPYWELLSLYWRAQMALETRLISKAYGYFKKLVEQTNKTIQQFQQANRYTKSYLQLRLLGEIGLAHTLAEQSDFKKALQALNKLTERLNSDETRLRFAMAWGKLHFLWAKREKKKENLQKALLGFLKITVLYPGYKRDYSEAIEYAIRCYKSSAISNPKQANRLEEERKFLLKTQ